MSSSNLKSQKENIASIPIYFSNNLLSKKDIIIGKVQLQDKNNFKVTPNPEEVVYYYSKPKEKIYSKYTINYIDVDTGKPIIESKDVDKQEVETKIYTKSLVIDIDDYTFKKADVDYFVVKENEDNIINLYYSKNEKAKEKEPEVVNIKIKDDTPTNNAKNTNNEKPSKDQVRVSNTGKTTYIHIILGISFIITGCTTIVLNKYYNKKKSNK